jgi:hypothetical protein
MLHPAAIVREEYKVLPMKKQARNLDQFIKQIRNDIDR